MKHADLVRKAAEFIYKADAIYVTAGAGFGVDSGLPDFRGDEGFYKAYPPMEKLGLSFIDCANPDWFYADPSFAWGFYGKRKNFYEKKENLFVKKGIIRDKPLFRGERLIVVDIRSQSVFESIYNVF